MLVMICRLEMISIKRASRINYKFKNFSTRQWWKFVSQIKCKLIQCRFREIIHNSNIIIIIVVVGFVDSCQRWWRFKREHDSYRRRRQTSSQQQRWNAYRSNSLWSKKKSFRRNTLLMNFLGNIILQSIIGGFSHRLPIIQ